MNNSINNLSPLDGRYSKKVSEITELFSEKALIQKRFIIEIEWLLFVLNESFYKTIKISKVDIKKINKFKNNFDQSYAKKIKSIENKTNHDVKAVEYFINDYFKKNKLKTKILGVTLLTSLDGKDSEKIYKERNTKKLVKKFTEIANNVNIHGLICSGNDLRVLGGFHKLIKITPGVKMFARNDDQKRVTFAHNALQDGASFVVIGRELIESKRPLDLLKKYGEQHKNKNLWTK